MTGDGVVRASEIGAMIGKRKLKIPRGLYYLLIWLLWHLHLKWIEAPPGIVDYSSYPWILDTTRAKNLLGWKPRYTAKETLRIMFETHDFKLVKKGEHEARFRNGE